MSETQTVETEQAAREASGAHPYGRYLEEFEVGDVYKHWPAKTVTESDDHLFCLITMNHHPLHLNDVYASKSQQGRNVVVGPLVYSLALGMSVSDVSGKAIANLATEELLHPAPVFHGDTLFCESEVLEKKESKSKPDRGTVKVHTRVLNQDGVLVAEFKRLVLVPRKNPARAPLEADADRRGEQRRLGRAIGSSDRPKGVFPFAGRPAGAAARAGKGARARPRHRGSRFEVMNTTAPAPTKNERLLAWVEEVASLTEPDDDPLVRRVRGGVRPALPGAGRGGHLRAAVGGQAPELLSRAVGPGRRRARRGPHVHLLGHRAGGGADEQLARPATRCARR